MISTFLMTVAATVVGNIISHVVCKWLDRHNR